MTHVLRTPAKAIDSQCRPATARARHGPVSIVDMLSLRPLYAETLRIRWERFVAGREELAALGLDEAFHRMWELYLVYSEAGFRSRNVDDKWTFAPTDRF